MNRIVSGAVIASFVVFAVGCQDSSRIVRAYSELQETELPQPIDDPTSLPDTLPDIDPGEEILDPPAPAAGAPLMPGSPQVIKPLLPTDPAAYVMTPTKSIDGVPGPLTNVYKDLGYADTSAGIRGLIAFPVRNDGALEAKLKEIYDPGSTNFRRYMTPAQWNADYAPTETDIETVRQWLGSHGMQVPRVASNRLLIQFTGTVGQFNTAFGAQLKVLERKPKFGNPPAVVYGLDQGLKAPKFITDIIMTVVGVDLPADTRQLPNEAGPVLTTPPSNISEGLTPKQIAAAYGVDKLWAQGLRGQGVKIGVTVGASFRLKDLDGFWQMFGVQRAMPQMVITMENPSTRYLESTIDVAWAGALAPEADVIAYIGPDARNTSMIYTFNEAIARGEVDVITDSFAHREDAEPVGVARAYNNSAKMSAALGITVVSASGDSGEPDVPSNSPYVTSVGGTALWMNGNSIAWEVAWSESGSGLSMRFPTPYWQSGITTSLLQGRRGVADVGLNASTHYWTLYLNQLETWGGTSFSSPVFAGLMACVNQGRAQAGKPPAGWINRALYESPTVQAAFRDVTSGSTSTGNHAGVGYDLPTGWGAPKADALLQALP